MAKKRKGRTQGAERDRRLAREKGVVIKDRGGRLAVALVYPNIYEVGMSNLGFQKVYQLLNRRDDVVCERAFLPGEGEKGKARSLESGSPLGEFDMVAFSITFEQDYINVLRILDAAGIPRRERAPEHPWVAAGGVCVTLNPEVMAPFMDMIFVGEGEGIIDPLIDEMVSAAGGVERFAGLPGVYVPEGYTPVAALDGVIGRIDVEPGFPARVKRVWADCADDPSATVIDTEDTVFGDMGLVEVGKGCGRHCRFCAAGYAYRPTRYASYGALVSKIDEALEKRGKVGLVGSAVADHPDIERIMGHIIARGGQFSVSSFRLEKLSDKVLAALAAGGAATITVAPEAGTERLRKMVNKDMSDEAILDAVGRAASAWPFSLKLYFLVGLPGETDEDVDGIAELVKRIHEAMVDASRGRGTIGGITVGVNGFVPKPFTPFQWEPFAGVPAITEKMSRVRKGLRQTPHVKLQTSSGRYDYIQAVLSVGDRRVARLVELACDMGGDWKHALKELKTEALDPDFIAMRRKGRDELLPWSVIDYGLREDYLARDLARSAKGTVIAECPPPGADCQRCGVFEGVCVESKTE